MPFYEYECPHCKYHDEVLQMINEKPLKKCPNCGKSGLKKLMSAPVFRLKGSGWYETDFKSDKENKRNLVGAEQEEPKVEAKADGKADAKTDAKVESKDDAKAKPETPKADPVKPKDKPRMTSRPKAKSRPAKSKSRR